MNNNHHIMPVDTDQPNENINDFSPEMIAQAIFTKDPKNPCSHQILALQEGTDLTYIFEILVTILLEGLNILTGDLKEADLSNFSVSFISSLNPWFNSLGFNINVRIENETEKELYQEYYCRTVINNELNETLFIIKNIQDKSYHFLLNGQYLDQNKAKTNLKDIFGIFNVNDDVYCITFDHYI